MWRDHKGFCCNKLCHRCCKRVCDFLLKFAYIDLKEEDSKKALELNGSVMLGKELVVKKALLMRDSYPGFSGRDRVLGGRFGGRFGGLDVGGRFRGGRCGGLGLCQRVC
ncbi:hypothetical protein CARUB_v10002653mg [Capsella rubella]|uniref:Uncharacterized protein n=1 Tax=Capsella rubella TaxID=81985 RepID=R0HEB8_9BRAS|nr:hypothetical protein CARUB_v10002653mg [Capsella rubella]